MKQLLGRRFQTSRIFLIAMLIPTGVSLLIFWISLFAAWQLSSSVNFAYPLLYDLIGIDETIAVYGPRNRFKKDIILTTRDERIRLFSAIVEAINHNGKGLREIRYHANNGRPVDLLLRESEVLHLQDVAKLLSMLRRFSLVVLFVTTILTGVLYWRRIQIPSVRYAFFAIGSLMIAAVAASVAYGPTKIFYQWHPLLFPDGHQWFFYYQDSLMTTMMKAPDIFAYIAVLILVTALMIFTVLWWLLEHFLATRPSLENP